MKGTFFDSSQQRVLISQIGLDRLDLLL